MQATAPSPIGNPPLLRRLGYFFMPPLITLVIFSLIAAVMLTQYQTQHEGRIYTGVMVGGVDLSQMNAAEAKAALLPIFPSAQQQTVTFIDPSSGKQWQKSHTELGLAFDVDASISAALDIGRSTGPLTQLQDLFNSWYYGHNLAPVIRFDEGKLETSLSELAAEINSPARDARLVTNANITPEYIPAQIGQQLDVNDLRARLIQPLVDFRQTEIELLIHEVQPVIFDDAVVAEQIERLTSQPVSFYLQKPLDDLDLGTITLSSSDLSQWLRVEVVESESNSLQHNVFVDENAVRHWLSQFSDQIYREPVNARFYFDDDTRKLVLVAPHINGRFLDLDATLDQFLSQSGTPNQSVPLIVEEIVPEVHSGVTAVDLGITELITSTTTWFRGSSDERKHNIARAAANFFGIVIAPGEEFSFNKYLGSISEDDGYTEGLIIIGGQTIKGVGGGVCQVSTTLYQTAFLSGFPITSRLAHGYMLNYYNDGQGPGMDATVYSPIVDTKFINNTPYHLLLENYYSEENQALTFKMYSTSLGRVIEKSKPTFENVTEIPGAEQDRWEFDPDLPAGTVVQIDYATEGADVFVGRTVYNVDGVVILDETVASHYIPVPNVYHYGPGVEPYDYSLVP